MGDVFDLGEVTCPSGHLVVLDGGCLGLWSGGRSPSEADASDRLPPGAMGSADFEVTGPDARAADPHRMPSLVPHRERALRCAREGLEGFLFSGMGAVAVGGVPADRPLTVTAEQSDGEWTGWKQMTLRVGQAPVASTRQLGSIGVDTARLAFADLDALSSWRHDDPIDGLADVVFWGGPHASEAAEYFGVPQLHTPGDGPSWGWADLPVETALQRARTIQAWKDEVPGRKLGLDFRPHSHHWQVMSQVRAAETESGTVRVGGADILFAMTSWGDGFFPASADYDAEGGLLAVRVALTDEVEP